MKTLAVAPEITVPMTKSAAATTCGGASARRARRGRRAPEAAGDQREDGEPDQRAAGTGEQTQDRKRIGQPGQIRKQQQAARGRGQQHVERRRAGVRRLRGIAGMPPACASRIAGITATRQQKRDRNQPQGRGDHEDRKLPERRQHGDAHRAIRGARRAVGAGDDDVERGGRQPEGDACQCAQCEESFGNGPGAAACGPFNHRGVPKSTFGAVCAAGGALK